MIEPVREEIAQLTASIRVLEQQLEVALAKRRIELNYQVHGGIVRFEQVVIAKHRLLKARLLHYILAARPLMILRNSIASTVPIGTIWRDFGPKRDP